MYKADSHGEQNVGIRPRSEVEETYRALEAVGAGTTQQTQFSRGALTGYLWALGRGDAAPITGAGADGSPDLSLLTAEVDASAAQLEDSTQRTVPRDYIQGVQAALAWVCGHDDARP
ncbi:hypothetical protein [Streptomyces sp. NPDC051569]|uniref:hypothetical protein n=1 Tax=Streptomyces sp. NPDC051569 TaxID=3365661 RepID=UPI003790C1B3